MKARTTDDVAAEMDFNFVPGERVSGCGMGIILSVDHERYECRVMWTMHDGRVVFRSHANYELRRAA